MEKWLDNPINKKPTLIHDRSYSIPTQNLKRYRTHKLDSAQFDKVKEHHVLKGTETQKAEDNLEVFIGRIYDEIERKDNVDESPKKGAAK